MTLKIGGGAIAVGFGFGSDLPVLPLQQEEGEGDELWNEANLREDFQTDP